MAGRRSSAIAPRRGGDDSRQRPAPRHGSRGDAGDQPCHRGHRRATSANGELIATFQEFENFLPEKKRYVSLAEDLDAVRVWGHGTVPKNCGKVDFVQTNDERIGRYWLVLFDSPDARAVLLGRQVNKATKFEDKKFVGFYSFNPYLVQSIRWRFNLLSCGLSKVIAHWEKSVSLPDLKMGDLERYLKTPVPSKA